MQSTSLHAAIIMDGNGRWARSRGALRPEGHQAGAHAARRVVTAAPGLGIGILTLYAFSADNWQRPAVEVRGILDLLARYLREERDTCVANGIRLTVIGRRDRLPLPLRGAIVAAERATRRGTRLWLRLAIDYSARQQILEAARRLPSGATPTPQLFAAGLGERGRPAPDVDLVIRTGGERRLSDFLLWEAAYAELIFSDVAWPDYDGDHLAGAVAEFRRRERRFGRVSDERGAS